MQKAKASQPQGGKNGREAEQVGSGGMSDPVEKTTSSDPTQTPVIELDGSNEVESMDATLKLTGEDDPENKGEKEKESVTLTTPASSTPIGNGRVNGAYNASRTIKTCGNKHGKND